MEEPAPKPMVESVDYPGEAFHMVTQVPWEEEVIWNGEDVRQKISAGQRQRGMAAGWVPSSSSRTAEQFIQLGESLYSMCGLYVGLL